MSATQEQIQTTDTPYPSTALASPILHISYNEKDHAPVDTSFQGNDYIHVSHRVAGQLDIDVQDYSLVLVNESYGSDEDLHLVSSLRHDYTDMPIILITSIESELKIIEALKLGIDDYVFKSTLFSDRLSKTVERVLEYKATLQEAWQALESLQVIEERYRDICDNTADLIQCLGPDGEFLYTNKTWRDTLGYSKEEINTMTLMDVLDPCCMEACCSRFEKLKAGEDIGVIEFTFLTKDKSKVELLGSCGTLFKEGKTIATRGIFKNITEKKQAEDALTKSEMRYQVLYDENPSMFFTLDNCGTILSCNKFGAQYLGFECENLIGKSSSIIYFEAEAGIENHLNTCLALPQSVHRRETRMRHQSNREVWVRETTRIMKDSDENDIFLVVCEDVTEAHDLSEELSFQVSHDALTGLHNRRAFDEYLHRALAQDTDNLTSHILCYLDLDQFKVINDTCGHIAGDELLRQVSRLLQKLVRKQDMLARLGGDEFGILMEHCALDQAERVTNAIREAIERFRFSWEDKTFSIGVSIGLVPVNEVDANVAGVLGAADTACYTAKDMGRNRIHIYRADDEETVNRHGEMQWVTRITQSLEKDEFKLMCQPIIPVAVGSAQPAHFEFLIRLEEEDGTITPPGAFLPAAERYNLSVRVDRWVVKTALNWLASNPDICQGDDIFTINLSGPSLTDPDFSDYVYELIKDSAVDAENLCFEITETAAIFNLTSATRFIEKYQQLGIQFALDDFGSGLSSFAYLKNLPVDYIKIDGVFVKDIDTQEVNLAMVKSINEIARAMDKQTIAEYVESEAILEKLREVGIDYAQGYHTGRPMSLKDTIIYLEARQE